MRHSAIRSRKFCCTMAILSVEANSEGLRNDFKRAVGRVEAKLKLAVRFRCGNNADIAGFAYVWRGWRWWQKRPWPCVGRSMAAFSQERQSGVLGESGLVKR